MIHPFGRACTGTRMWIAPLLLAALLAAPSLAWATSLLDFEGTTAESDNYKVDKDKLPVSGTTDFNAGVWDKVDPLNTAEHELMHVIGFSLQYDLFKAVVNASNEIKVGDKVFGITDGTSHLDPTKSVTIDGTTFDQSKDIMRPDKVEGQRVGTQDKLILNAIYNWTGLGGLAITVNFTGDPFSADDKKAINDAVTAVQNLFGPVTDRAHKITWDAQNAKCLDPTTDEDLSVCSVSVPEPGSLALLTSALIVAAIVCGGRRRAAHSFAA